MNRLDFDMVKFPNGELKLVLLKELDGKPIIWEYNSPFNNGKGVLTPPEELVLLLQLNYIMEKFGVTQQVVKADFLPFKRQDKDKLKGEIKFNVIYKTMTNLKFEEFAPHDSDEFTKETCDTYMENVVGDNTLVVFPDVGANRRFVNTNLGDNCVDFTKHRDANTGQISFLPLEPHKVEKIKGKDCFILDDIGAYYGTFKHSSNELVKAGAKSVTLVLNHDDGCIDLEKDLIDTNIDKLILLNGNLNRKEITWIKH